MTDRVNMPLWTSLIYSLSIQVFVDRGRRHVGVFLVRTGLILAIFSGAPRSMAEEFLHLKSTQRFLREETVSETDGQKSSWQEAGVKCELLIRFGRLLPRNISREEKRQLAVDLQDSNTNGGSALENRVAGFPKADGLDFDGQRYSGGNLGFIDSLLGKSGRPIAFDRELPAILVPLERDLEAELVAKRISFQVDNTTREIRDATEQNYGNGTALQMFGDGQFLRAYSGRFDDLYFHLFQNGTGTGALAFHGLADGLSERVYQPVVGLRPRVIAAGTSFDLDDILSDGGKSAVASYLRTQRERREEPFKGFAFRVLPGMMIRAGTLPAGARFNASQEDIVRAFRSRQHLYPTQVPALYRSPDRFLGWTGSLLIQVANRVGLPANTADSWYPLPIRESHSQADIAMDDASSAQLFKASELPKIQSSNAMDIVWEDPQLSTLLSDADKEEPDNAGGAAVAESVRPSATGPKVEPDPRRRKTPVRLIAVVTPTSLEATEYRKAIQISDEKLRTIEKARGCIHLLRQYIETARESSGPQQGETASSSAFQQAMLKDLASFDSGEIELTTRLQAALHERSILRKELENKLRDQRIAPLQARGKVFEDEVKSEKGILL